MTHVSGWRVVVPVKGGGEAKSRLALPGPARRSLALAMALDCLAVCLATPGVGLVVCVSDDPEVTAAARATGAVTVSAGRPGLGAAIAAGVACLDRGPTAVLLGDLPALRAEDLAAALADALTRPGPALVTDAEGSGSVLLADRDGAPPHRFGPGSARAHLDAGARPAAGRPGLAAPRRRHRRRPRRGPRPGRGAPHPRRPRRRGDPAALTRPEGTMSNPLPSPRRRHAAPAGAAPSAGDLAGALGAAAGGTLDAATAEVLLHARGEDLRALCALAAPVRDAAMAAAGRPGVVTYSRKVFVPVTRLCRDRCHYCTFATVPGRLPVLYLSEDDVLRIAREGAAAGCKEALFTLGDAPEDRWPAARAWLSARGFASHAGLRAAPGAPRPRRDGAAAAPQPGGHVAARR